MCGIAGLVDQHLRLPDAHGTLGAMCDQLVHRGPDDCGSWWDDALRIGLGHRRLAIVDISPAGHQPMVSACGRWAIAFNGEIYDFERLRAELDSRRSTRWRGHSDTEVLLERIAVDGFERAVSCASGMFALAAVDRQEGLLWLASDRAGKKPVYYGWVGGMFAFASELKALAALGRMPTIDRLSAASMLQLGYVPAPWTIFEGVRKLNQGTLVRVDLRSLVDGQLPDGRAYWAIRAVAERRAQGGADSVGTVDRLEQVLEGAVRRRLVADVPVGAFLSGGIDSSIVCALMARTARGRVHTFSIGFEDGVLDESVHARRVADALGTEHVCHRLSDSDMLSVVPRLPEMFDEPFADSSQIPTYLVSHLARGHVTVALSGDGGDELFGGYSRYLLALDGWRKMAWMPGGLRAVAATAIRSCSPFLRSLDGNSRLSERLPLGAVRSLLRSPNVFADCLSCREFPWFYVRLMSNWQESPIAGLSGLAHRPNVITESSFDVGLLGPEDWMMATDFATYLHGDILTKVDRASMATSLEVRCPFLDSEVVDFAWALPAESRIGSRGLKVALGDLARRLVPREVVDRPKMGFGVPLARWLRGPLREWANDLLSRGTIERHGLLEFVAIDASLRSLHAGRDSEQSRVWSAASLMAWAERWR